MAMDRVTTLDQNSVTDRIKAIRDEIAIEAEANKDFYNEKLRQEQAIHDLKVSNIKKIKQLGLIATKTELAQKKEAIIQAEEAKVRAAYLAERKGKKGKLTNKEKAEIRKKAEEAVAIELAIEDKKFKKGLKLRENLEKKDANKKAHEEGKNLTDGLFGKGNTLRERGAALKAAFTNDEGNTSLLKGLSTITAGLSDLAKKMEQNIDKIASTKSAIDTRLQGSKNETKLGSYWDKMSDTIVGVAGVSPLVKQEAIVEKVKTMVSQGISYNVEQRAFLSVVSDKIATTFNAADGALLRLVRLQQQDSTAARLGMESAMTAFLNNMYETTEYMGAIADGIRGQIEEATALMTAEESIGFEYQVQKWMGSMYSVGMSQSTTSAIAGALGKLAAGDISGLTGDKTGNLMIMAANNAGLNISEVLAQGLDESSTNSLLKAMVEYLSGIYSESQGSKVLQQQFANVYGLTASDLKAISNLAGSTNVIAADGLNYNTAMNRLNNMAASMYSRTSIGEMQTNMWDNLQYSMAAGIANNAVLYGTYKMANLLSDLTGGINIGGVSVMGTTVLPSFNVADTMRVAALGGGILNSLGDILSGGGGLTGAQMLKTLGISNGITTVSRGKGSGLITTGGGTLSESGSMVAGGGDDVTGKAMADSKNEVASAVDDSTDVTLSTVNDNIVLIHGLVDSINSYLGNVISGNSIKVDMGDQSAWTNALKGGGL